MHSPTRLLERLRSTRRWTETEGRAVIAALGMSGATVEAFAAAHGLHPERVARWRRRLASSSAAEPAVLPVEVTTTPRSARPRQVELVLGQRVLRVPADLEPDELGRLIRAVEAA